MGADKQSRVYYAAVILGGLTRPKCRLLMLCLRPKLQMWRLDDVSLAGRIKAIGELIADRGLWPEGVKSARWLRSRQEAVDLLPKHWQLMTNIFAFADWRRVKRPRVRTVRAGSKLVSRQHCRAICRPSRNRSGTVALRDSSSLLGWAEGLGVRERFSELCLCCPLIFARSLTPGNLA